MSVDTFSPKPQDNEEAIERAMRQGLTREQAEREFGTDRWTYFEDPVFAAGFIQMPAVVHFDNTLSRDARWLYGTLLRAAWNDPFVWPGIESLCEAAGGCKEETILRYRRELENRGLIKTVRRGLGKSNLYIFKPLSEVYKNEPEPEPDPEPDKDEEGGEEGITEGGVEGTKSLQNANPPTKGGYGYAAYGGRKYKKEKDTKLKDKDRAPCADASDAVGFEEFFSELPAPTTSRKKTNPEQTTERPQLVLITAENPTPQNVAAPPAPHAGPNKPMPTPPPKPPPPRPTNWFEVFKQRMQEQGMDKLTPEDKQRVPGHLRALAREVNGPTMHRVINNMVEGRFRGYYSSPQKCYEFLTTEKEPERPEKREIV